MKDKIAFTRHEVPGALRNGTRVEKSEFKPNDGHQIGAKATILGSIGPIEFEGNPEVYGYFVEWDDLPGVPCFITSTRVRKIDFEIGPNGEWIRCPKCGMKSYNPNDVKNGYCASCHCWRDELHERK